MTSFHVHEDFGAYVENAKPKQKVTKGCVEKNKNRAVLQPLTNHQQNLKRPKPGTGKENTDALPMKKEIESKLPKEETDIISLKPVLKRINISSRITFTGATEKEYEESIWNYLNLMEKKIKIKPFYMTKQMYLTWDMRSVLIDWLVNVADEYQLSNHTIHLSVIYLDRFLSNLSVIREKFQLVGATAMMLAGKVEEIYPPDIKEWSYLTGDTFTVRQILKMEQLMLKVLDFEVNPPTILDFIKHLCAKLKLDNKTKYLAMYLSELVLLEGKEYLQYFPSKLAAACLALARHTLLKPEPWSRKLEETSGYSLKQLSPVVQRQQKTFKSSPFKEHQAIQKKYASDKYQRVALLKPRILVLDDEE